MHEKMETLSQRAVLPVQGSARLLEAESTGHETSRLFSGEVDSVTKSECQEPRSGCRYEAYDTGQ